MGGALRVEFGDRTLAGKAPGEHGRQVAGGGRRARQQVESARQAIYTQHEEQQVDARRTFL